MVNQTEPTPQQWQRIRHLFDRAASLPECDRHHFIEESSMDDPLVIIEVRRMLAAHEASDEDFLAPPLSGVGHDIDHLIDEANTSDRQNHAELPDKIGDFRIIRKLGEGGMGVVYEAEQQHPARRVALKVMRDPFSSEKRQRRFEAEADLLARLQHPGIAQVFDVGTFENEHGMHHYFVMELIEGQPLLQFAREHQLDTSSKLRLVAQIARAIHHAHMKGVIHRDIKPSNILIVEDAHSTDSHSTPPSSSANQHSTTTRHAPFQIKIIDFGIARHVADNDGDAHSVMTATGQLVGTLPYMSPEQARGNPNEIDIRCDVYGLGVLAYQLLTDELPHNVRDCSVPEAISIIQTQTPKRLRTFDERYRGDIETIIAKALERDRERRYQSTLALAEDIERSLGNLPITARPPSAMYRFSKLTRRHRAMVIGCAVAVVGLLLGTATSVWWAIEANREADRAEIRTATAERTINFLQTTMLLTNPRMADTTVTIDDLLDRASSRVTEELADEPAAQLAMHLTIADAFRARGRWYDSIPHLKSASVLTDRLNGRAHTDSVCTLHQYMNVLIDAGRFDRAKTYAEQELNSKYSVAARTAIAFETLAAVAHHAERYHQSLSYLIDARAAWDRAVETVDYNGNTNPYAHYQAAMLTDLAKAAHSNKQPLDDVITIARDALESQLALLPVATEPIFYSRGYLSKLLLERNQPSDVEEAEEFALAALHDIESTEGSISTGVSVAKSYLARVREAQGNIEATEELLQETLDIRRTVLGNDHADLIYPLRNLGKFYQRHGQRESAEECFSEMLSLAERYYEPGHPLRKSAATYLNATR